MGERGLLDELDYLIRGVRAPARPVIEGPQEARVVGVGPDGLLRFVIPSFSADHAFDGARWTRPPGTSGPPPPGTLCLVEFVGTALTRPWVLAWWGWDATTSTAAAAPASAYAASAAAPGAASSGGDSSSTTTQTASAAAPGAAAVGAPATASTTSAPAPDGSVFWFDISHYQADASPALDLQRMFALGYAGCMAKIGQGAGTKDDGSTLGAIIDTAWSTYKSTARNLWGRAFAGYWYVGSTEAPADQATRCKNALGDLTIPVVLDWEDGGGQFSNLLNVLSAFRSAGIKVTGLYCGSGYANGHGASNIDQQTGGLSVIRARYYTNDSGVPRTLWDGQPAGFGYETFNGATPKAHQFTQYGQVPASTTGSTMTLDVSDFPGTRAGLAALLQGG